MYVQFNFKLRGSRNWLAHITMEGKVGSSVPCGVQADIFGQGNNALFRISLARELSVFLG